MRTPTVSAKPIVLTVGSWSKMNRPKTTAMMRAAEVTTRPLRRTPCSTTGRASPWWWKYSRMRLTRNTS